MAIRVDASDVRKLIDLDPSLDLEAFIIEASALTDAVEAADADSMLTESLLFAIEANLAAHFAEPRDPQYTSKSTDGASGAFQGQTGLCLENTKWGQKAMMLDISGYLVTLNAKDAGKRVASLQWMGRKRYPYVGRGF